MGSAELAPGLVFDVASHTYRVGDRELPSVTRILQDAGLADFSKPWFTEERRERGQLVHAAIALDNEGELDEDSLDPVLYGYVEGWRRYLHEVGGVVEHFEQPVYDEASGYAGTLDAIVCEPPAKGTVPRRTVLDVKPGLYPSVGPQTAAYLRCARRLYDTPVLFNRAALILPGDGTYTREPLTDVDDELVFLAATRLWHWRTTHGLR